MNKTTIDFILSDIQLDSKMQQGLLLALSDELEQMLDQTADTENPSEEQRNIIVYEFIRNHEAIEALLESLKENQKEQNNKLKKLYKELIEGDK